ncbi:capsular biosynthesis protein [Agrobacterium arsenijevicii]|uniref:Capsular biosynthesis protein n=1 Tax=Agrobacterium arsenijevicii TaxID=1585697 RepID=A0ABR5D4D8_9HYPH|nr:capsular biosynthesis protein [Agrobacterium arsenijevicii]
MKTAFFVGFSPWKEHLTKVFADEHCHFIDKTTGELLAGGWPLHMLRTKESSVYVWGFKYPSWLKIFCKQFNIPFFHVEDGFVRSVTLGAHRAPPISLIFDSQTPYYDSRKASALESLLNTYDFSQDPSLLERARKCVNLLLSLRVSKYNLGKSVDPVLFYGPKTKKRVLVIGQVERDASIEFGCDRKITNNDLVRLAASENVDAEIIYKPHPEILHGTRRNDTDPDEVAHLCSLLTEDISVSDALETIDHVYTITSLLGFEALLRGKRVTCLGLPFYAGWGATDDRQDTQRRTRELNVFQIFAGSYLLHSRYFHPLTGAEISLEDAITLMHQLIRGDC